MGIRVGYGTGWVGGGVYRPPAPREELLDLTAKRAPEAPARGLEWVVRARSGRVSQYPPCGPGRSCGPPWYWDPLRTPFLANRGEI